MAVQNLLDPQVLVRLSNIELVARTVVDGFLTGLHRSPFFGFSLDFAEYRPHVQGDDPRFVQRTVDEQDPEPIFANPAQHIVRANLLAQAIGDGSERFISAVEPVGVCQVTKLVEIEITHCVANARRLRRVR